MVTNNTKKTSNKVTIKDILKQNNIKLISKKDIKDDTNNTIYGVNLTNKYRKLGGKTVISLILAKICLDKYQANKAFMQIASQYSNLKKSITTDAKKAGIDKIHATIRDSYKVLDNTASDSTFKKFAKSLNNMHNTDIVSDIITFCTKSNIKLKTVKKDSVKAIKQA
jgi:hypothetical protein